MTVWPTLPISSRVSYDDPNKVTLILNVDPFLEPSNGPNYFPFDPEILYEIKIDNNNDAVADVAFQFRFSTEVRLPGVFTGFVGAFSGITAPASSPKPVAPGTPLIPPAITALDGPGSEGLGLRQSYTVTMVKGGVSTVLGPDTVKYAVPSNVGPRTMPDYASLAKKGIYNLCSAACTAPAAAGRCAAEQGWAAPPDSWSAPRTPRSARGPAADRGQSSQIAHRPWAGSC